MEKNTTKILRNSLHDFVCKKCDYTWSRKGDFNNHLKSKKHSTTNTAKIQQNILHYCECEKKTLIALPFSVRLIQVVLVLFQQLLR